MNEMKDIIASYEKSIGSIHERIQQLHRKIEALGGEGNCATRAVASRRYLLYCQLWEMQRSKTSLERYLVQVEGRKNTLGEVPIPALTVTIKRKSSLELS